MKKYKYIFLILLLINKSLISCSFQISLFKKLNEKNKNLTISPLSIFQALSLVSNGAKDETLKELLTLLDGKGLNEINEINSKILSLMKEMSSLEIANAIMSKLSPLPKFSIIAKDKYSSEIQPLKSVKQVNNWCDKKTHGKITKIIEALDESVFMIILNAVYFKGDWVYKFKKESTTKKMFYNFNSQTNGKNVDMMQITQFFLYFEDSNLQAIRLPYEKDSISAIVILPKKDLNINEFIELLDKDNEYFYSIIDNFKSNKVNLEVPKFEITYTKSLKKVLKDMGVNLAFSSKADFSNIRSQNDIMIDEVIHKTYLKVDEKGTEAAAITMIEMKFTGMAPQFELIHYMKVNRPFLFILRNEEFPKNHDILFISKIEEIN